MSDKIVQLAEFKSKTKDKRIKMLFLIIIIAIILALLTWHYAIDNADLSAIKIPESRNVTYNSKPISAVTTMQIANEFNISDDKPVLLYIYTSWCNICVKNFPIFNEIAREFQSTDLRVIAIAIDRETTTQELEKYLNNYGNVYFETKYLANKEGFIEFLKKKGVSYNKMIPFTVLFSPKGELVLKYVGVKSKEKLRRAVIQQLYLKND